ncbi:MAG TPA: hypothetical protein VLI92_01810 [Candidatus Saccharimonadales bacterium]|nr:hypothetical protein [Candidatus Saccharimonadales bacterium]
MDKLSDLLKTRNINKSVRSHNKYEYQAYGNRLADEFGDSAHRALYIRLAKLEDRNLLDAAREYVMRSENATTKGKLFMWKLSQLKKAVVVQPAK